MCVILFIVDVVSYVLAVNHLKVVRKVPLSNSAVLRRIEDMSLNI
jgi:hypothetical protein